MRLWGGTHGRLTATALAALAALPCISLASPIIEKGKRQLVIWGVTLGPDTKGLEAVVHAFEAANPDVHVRVLSMGAGGMNPQKQMTAIVGGSPPDIIQQDRFSMADWASRGAFLPLDDLIARDRNTDSDCPTPEKFYPAAWAEAVYEGKVYGIPDGADNRALYWNREIFRAKAAELRAAGLNPDRPPRTWSEVKAYNKVLTEFKPDGTLMQAGFMPNFGNSWFYMFAFQNNAKFMSDDGKHCTLDSPPAEEALQFMLDCYEQLGGYENARAFEAGFGVRQLDGFYGGRVAMKIDGDWSLNNLARYAPTMDVAVAPPPVPDDRFYHRGLFTNEKDTFITWMGGFCQVIPRGARNVEDAWRYIKFALSLKGKTIKLDADRRWQISRGHPYISGQMANLEANRMILNRYAPADEKFRKSLEVHVSLMQVSRVRPPTFVGQLLWDQHVEAMDKTLRRQMSAKAALQAGQAVVQRELDAFYSQDKYPQIDLRVPIAIFALLGLAGAGVLNLLYRRHKLGRLSRHEARWGYALVSPWVFGFAVLTLGPMLMSLFFSFTRYNVLSPPRWVGVQNYAEMVGADRATFLKAFSNALYFAGIGVPLSLITGLGIALLLNTGVRGMRFYRTFFYMPSIVPATASAVLWAWLLAPDASKGLLNAAWSHTIQPWLGASAPGWVTSEAWAKDSLIMMGVWGAGSGMLLWLAGLKGVPTQLYEASAIDGATPKQQFWRITMPQLSPVIFFNLVVGLVGAMQEFDRVYVMKPDEGTVGPGDSLLMPVYHLFNNGFAFFRMGYASAIAWIIFFVILALTVFQFWIAPRWVHYEVER